MDKIKILKDNVIARTNLKIASIIDTQHTSIFKHINQIQDIVATPITLAVTGEFSAGKSTFINRLLGIKALPVSILPKTATITKVVYGKTEKIEIDYFENDKISTKIENDYKSLKSLQNAKKIDDKVFSEEIENIKEVRVYVDNPLLKRFTLMDTPGFNHDIKMDNKTINAIQSANIVIWLSDNSQLAKKTEFDRLNQIKKFVKFIYLIINKADIAIANSDEYKKAYDKTAISLKDNNFIDFFDASDTYLISCKTNIEFWDGKFQQFLADFGRNVLDNDLDLSINIIKDTSMLLYRAINDKNQLYIKLGSKIDSVQKIIDFENIYEKYEKSVIKDLLPDLEDLLSCVIKYNDKTNANTKIDSVNEYITEFLWNDVVKNQNSIKSIYDNLFNDIKKSHLKEVLNALKTLISKIPKNMSSLYQNLDIIYQYYNLGSNDKHVVFNDVLPLTFNSAFLKTLTDKQDIVAIKSRCRSDFKRSLYTIFHTSLKKVLADFTKTTMIEQFSIALKEMDKLKEYNLDFEEETQLSINSDESQNQNVEFEEKTEQSINRDESENNNVELEDKTEQSINKDESKKQNVELEEKTEQSINRDESKKQNVELEDKIERFINRDESKKQNVELEEKTKRFINNGDGTITDLKTELMWQQSDDGKKRNWQDAHDYCKTLHLANYCDWRLPTKSELESIVLKEQQPTININCFINCKPSWYWSGSTYADNINHAWYVHFRNNNVYYHKKTNNYYIRCVRLGQSSIALKEVDKSKKQNSEPEKKTKQSVKKDEAKKQNLEPEKKTEQSVNKDKSKKQNLEPEKKTEQSVNKNDSKKQNLESEKKTEQSINKDELKKQNLEPENKTKQSLNKNESKKQNLEFKKKTERSINRNELKKHNVKIAGKKGLYINHGNGTITDLNTKLMWQQSDDGKQRNWKDAHDYCKTLHLADYCNWRLPTKSELESLVLKEQQQPTINIDCFTNCKSSYYWAGSAYDDCTDVACGISFSNGFACNLNKSFDFFIRCVRSRQFSIALKEVDKLKKHNIEPEKKTKQSINRNELKKQNVKIAEKRKLYINHGNGTITDFKTKLMWQQSDDGKKRNWQDAHDYCKTLHLADYCDWRLPTKSELESIVLKGQQPTINIDYFINCKSSLYWSSSTHVKYSVNAWNVNFCNGNVDFNVKPRGYFVRCVRSGA